jgi:putative component of membrane protein insertase Oxa1/YidC/SpoIIIJ protein YidD
VVLQTMMRNSLAMQKNNVPVIISVWIIKEVWQTRLGKWHNKKRNIICRFYPSCSRYAIRALYKYGFLLGWLLAVKRVKRCRTDNCDSCYDMP